MQEIYAEPIKPELIGERIREIKDAGVVVVRVGHARSAPSRSPSTSSRPSSTCSSSRARSCRPSTSPRRSSRSTSRRFVRELDIPVIVGGCASYQAALHLMRTGAAGVLVGVGPGHACTTRGVLGIGVPQATAIADARAARMRHLDETGVYVHVIADGGMGTGGDIAKAIVCGADAVMIGSPLAAAAEAPGRGYHWGMATFHPTLPRGARVQAGAAGHARGDPRRPGPRERRPPQPVRRPAHLDGHLRLRDGQGVPEGRGHGGAGAADRGQVAPAGRRASGWVTEVGRPRDAEPFDTGPRRRLRRPVRPAHRPPGARGARLQRDRAPHHHRRRDRRPRSRRASSSRRARSRSTSRARPRIDPASTTLGVPVLGICYGAQLVAQQLGGEVARTGRGEYGRTELDASSTAACSSAPTSRPTQHGVDEPLRLDHRGARRASPSPRRTADAPVAALEDAERGIYGVQFHPEVVAHAARPGDARSTSSTTSAAASPTWTMTSIIETQVERDPGAGRPRPGDLRPVRRRRLRGRRRARAQGHRPPAHLRVRRHRAACARARASRSSRPSAATRASS